MSEFLTKTTDGLVCTADTEMPKRCQQCPSRSGWGCMEFYRGVESVTLEECGPGPEMPELTQEEYDELERDGAFNMDIGGE